MQPPIDSPDNPSDEPVAQADPDHGVEVVSPPEPEPPTVVRDDPPPASPPPSPTFPTVVSAFAGAVAVAASVAEVLNAADDNKLLVGAAVLSLLAVGSGAFSFQRAARLVDEGERATQKRWSGGFAALGALGVIVTVVAALGVHVSVGDTPSTPSASSSPSATPSVTPTTTTEPPPPPGQEVTLTNEDTDGGKTIAMKAVVHQEPRPGRSYWAVLKLTWNKNYVEYYAKKELAPTVGDEQKFDVEVATLKEKRSVRVYEVDASTAEELQKQLDSDFDNTDAPQHPPCECAVSEPVSITP